jgi:hypothetical protein
MKIEILIKDKNTSVNKLSFEDSDYQLSGNFIIISTKCKNNDKIFSVYDLSTVKSYKIYE